MRANDGEQLIAGILYAKSWEAELTRILGVKVDLDLANPELSLTVVAPAVKREGFLTFGEPA